MKTTITLFLALSYSFTFAQIAGKKTKDAVVIFDSITVHPGDTLHLGTGSDKRTGDFVFLYQPPNILLGVKENPMPKQYAGKYVVVKHFKMQRDKRTGDKTIAVINPQGFLNYVADMENAIREQEIIGINSRSLIKKDEPQAVTVVNNTMSVADELTKLKKLMDEGLITKEEYDQFKKKLLEKNEP